MKKTDVLKSLVREKYAAIAEQNSGCCSLGSCCDSQSSGPEVYTIMSESYEQMEGYDPGADLQLGCGLPTRFARISPGDTVVDLGSGAGNDCFVARAETGSEGRVIGLDFTPEMVERARANALKLGYSNVEFALGDIEAMPLQGALADVVVSNCVLNLVPDKERAFSEIFRILKPGGHFSISDIVLEGELPLSLKNAAEMYAGCVSGAIQKETYLELLRAAGFSDIEVQKKKPIILPQEVLEQYLSSEEFAAWSRMEEDGIFSITVFGRKPSNSFV